MPLPPDLEISLYRVSPNSYSAELRLSHDTQAQPRSHAASEVERRWDRRLKVDLDLAALRSAELDMAQYGQLLGRSLFGSEGMKEAFSHASGLAQGDQQLRLRLFIDPEAPELHALRWEALRDPKTDAPLFLDEHVLFSRYLSSWDWQPVRARTKGELRALVAIANPSDLGNWKPEQRSLAPVDVAGELTRARDGLGDIQVTALDSGGKATLDGIFSQLREGHDILYLVCHGVLVKGEPWLWLESQEGRTDRVPGSDFIQRMKELRVRPRLVVLASCQSAGSGDSAHAEDGGLLAALGPSLAEVGVPAVLAMQGNVTMKTMADFMPAFFSELRRAGQIDQAMTVARGRVRGRPDWWMPVLFMRLKSGRLWFEPGFTESKDFERWPVMLQQLSSGKCTPILGPGMVEHLIGASRDMAQKWAEDYRFPMAPHEGEDLAQVTQFLAAKQAPIFPRQQLVNYVWDELPRRVGDAVRLPEESDRAPEEAVEPSKVNERLSRAGALVRKSDAAEPHRVLAELPCSIYITTNFDDLLVGALREAKKSPRVEFCRWKRELEPAEGHPLLQEQEPGYKPTREQPLVYHLFGRYEIPESMVLTQDDYLDFLIGYTRNKELIPVAVRRALTQSALLFIGFQVDAIGFRVLFRSIISQEGGQKLEDFAHVAAQVDPEEGRILEPESARKYLESYFSKRVRVSVFWGDTKDFMRTLLQKRGGRS